MNRTFELDVIAFRNEILRLAQEKNVDSMVVVCATAEIFGLTAAMCDQHGVPMGFDHRMELVTERARQAYRRKTYSGPMPRLEQGSPILTA